MVELRAMVRGFQILRLARLPTISVDESFNSRRTARADYLVERDGFEPEISLAVLPNTQSELPFG